ncbi:hypothetical protein ABGB07_23860 [Micromonosporaceae bacterium B7E4]
MTVALAPAAGAGTTLGAAAAEKGRYLGTATDPPCSATPRT